MGVPLLPAAARRLEGKVAIITGGARGIGESIAKHFFKHGAKVVIADILDDLGIPGALKFNILENEYSDFQNVLNVNLVGAFLGTKHAAKAMIPAGQGSIIISASVCSSIGGIGPYAYTSSKHGLLGLMRNATIDLGRYGIRVNCVSPHVVPTQMTRELFKLKDGDEFPDVYSHNFKCGDILRKEDVAEVGLYLASDASRFVSGHNFVLDGGFTAGNQGLCSYQQFGN